MRHDGYRRLARWLAGAVLLVAAVDTGNQPLVTALTVWTILGLLLIVGIRPPVADDAIGGRLFDAPLAGLLLLGGYSAFWWTVDPGGSILGLVKLAGFVLLALALPRLLTAPLDYRPLFVWLALLAGGMALYGFLQLALGWNVMGGRLHALFLTPNSLAGFLAATLPMSVALGLTARGAWSRWGFTLAAVLQAVALAATASRGGWLAAAAGLALFVLIAGRRDEIQWRTIFRPLAAGALLVAVSVMVMNLIDPGLIRPRLVSLGHLLTAEPQRYLIWQSALEMIAQRPMAGWGLGSFGVAYTPFKSPVFEGVTQYYVHNDYLQVAVELGLIGLAVLFWLIGTAGWMALRAWQHGRPDNAGTIKSDRPILAAVIGGGSAVLLHSLVDFDLYVPVIGLILAIFLSYLRSCSALAQSGRGKNPTLPPIPPSDLRPEPLHRRTYVAYLAARRLVVIVCGLALALLAGRLALASYEDGVGQRLYQAGQYDASVDRFTAAVRWNPLETAYYTRLGLAYEHWANQARRHDLLLNAEAVFRTATQVGPHDYQSFWMLGKFYLNYQKFYRNFNEFDPWSAYRRAMELHPTHAVIRREFGTLPVAHPDDRQHPEKTTLFSLTDRARLLSLTIARL